MRLYAFHWRKSVCVCVCVCVLSGKISRQQQVQTRTTLPFHAYGFNGRWSLPLFMRQLRGIIPRHRPRSFQFNKPPPLFHSVMPIITIFEILFFFLSFFSLISIFEIFGFFNIVLLRERIGEEILPLFQKFTITTIFQILRMDPFDFSILHFCMN